MIFLLTFSLQCQFVIGFSQAKYLCSVKIKTYYKYIWYNISIYLNDNLLNKLVIHI